MRNHVSGVLPNALVSRIAISGLIPDLPLTTLLSACRVTPKTFAPAVTDRPKGSRQSCRTMRPGCTGFFIGRVLLSRRANLIRAQFFHTLTADLDFAFVLAGCREVVRKLHAQPRLLSAAERFGQPDRHLRADAGLAVDDVIERLPGDAENLCPCGDGQAQGLKAIMPDDAAGINGVFGSGSV